MIPPTIDRVSEQFLQSYIMAVNQLTRQGFLALGSKPELDAIITLTGKGQLAETQHLRRDMGRFMEFDRRYQEALGERSTPPEQRDAPSRDENIQKQREREMTARMEAEAFKKAERIAQELVSKKHRKEQAKQAKQANQPSTGAKRAPSPRAKRAKSARRAKSTRRR